MDHQRAHRFQCHYLATHASEAAAMQSGPLAGSLRPMMALVGPVIGVMSGLVLGLFAIIARWLLGRTARIQTTS